ncbi:MAG: hypothetical protein J6T10_16770 [Methanobrevibacter sp.]|nr:hypothetical protein [Methanobrevibacter sp.]
MQLSEQQRNKIAQYIIDLYKNGIIDKDGKFTNLGDEKQKEFTGTSFLYCVAGEEPVGKYVEENNLEKLRSLAGSIWLLFDKDRSSWNWLFILAVDSVVNNDAKLEAVLNLNREMYGLKNKTSLEKAAELLDDSNEFEDI